MVLDSTISANSSTAANERYRNSFRLFSRRTDEKDLLASFIVRLGRVGAASRVLDIGAGDGGITERIQSVTQKIVAVEPNPEFANLLRAKGIKVLQGSWERVEPEGVFNTIIASHVVTYFPDEKLLVLIEKMIQFLAPQGRIILVTVDQERGSWRDIHTFFYSKNKIQKRRTSVLLQSVLKKYDPKIFTFTTQVRARSIEEMFDILAFDFSEYESLFSRTKPFLRKFLQQHVDQGKPTLEVCHQVLVVEKTRKR